MYLRIRVPRVTPGLASNLLGLAGIAGLLLAVAVLTDWRWALGLGSLVALGLSYVAKTQEQAERRPAPLVDQRQVERAVTGALRELARQQRLVA
jgi:hypothetical protein